MAEQRQGTICFLMGLLALGAYFLIEGADGVGSGLSGSQQPTFQVAATHQAALRSDLDLSHPRNFVTGQQVPGWRRVYFGSVLRDDLNVSERYDWTVSIYGLPLDANGQETLVVHSKQRPTAGWKSDSLQSKGLEVVSAYRRDFEGNWTQALGAPTDPWIVRSLDCLLAPRGQFASSATIDAAKSSMMLDSWQAPTGTSWSFRPLCRANSADSNGADQNDADQHDLEQTWLAQCRGGEQAFADVQQQIRLTFDQKDQRVSVLSSQVREKLLHAETRWTSHLEFLQETTLAPQETELLAQGIDCWEMSTSAYHDVFSLASMGQVGSSSEVSDTLASLHLKTTEHCERVRHPLIAFGMQRALVDQATSHLRLQAAVDQTSLLRAAGLVKWRLTDGDAVEHDQAKHLGKVVVLGFASDTRPESLGMLNALAQVRSQWSECDVAVFNVVNFEHGVKASLIEGLIETNIVPLEDNGTSERLGICHVGFPTVMVLNQQAELHSLCPWQIVQSPDLLQASIAQLVSSSSEEESTRLTSLPETNHNRSRLRVDRTHTLFGKNQNIDGTELFILAAGAYGGPFSSSRWDW